MTTQADTRYDKLERKFIEIAQEMLDNYGVNKADLIDIINDQTDEEVEE